MNTIAIFVVIIDPVQVLQIIIIAAAVHAVHFGHFMYSPEKQKKDVLGWLHLISEPIPF